jgi:hypothetical protein
MTEFDQKRPIASSKKEKLRVKTVRNSSFLIRLIYAICLAGASFNHARIVAAHGLDWNYGGLPVFVCVFWTALTFVDALAVILLMTKPILGLCLATAIIVCDVVINAWVGVSYGFDVASFVAQALFLLFVMSTVGIAWRSESGRPIREHARA